MAAQFVGAPVAKRRSVGEHAAGLHTAGKEVAKKLWFCGFLILSVGCGPSERPERASSRIEPRAAFSVLEERLLNAATARFDFQVSAQGAFEADLQGVLAIGPADRVQLTAVGQFGGQPVDLLLRSEGEELEFGTKTNRRTATRPPHLREALLVGLTRMGILHNLARLTSASAPDHAEGGVRDWVTVDSFSAGTNDADVLSFDLTVAGQPAGSASLTVDSRGRPLVRRQTVQFPSGEMRVVERYSAVTIDP